MNQKYKDAKTQQLILGKQIVAYRRLGEKTNPTLLFLNHLASTLDSCDPEAMDALAQYDDVIALDYQGVGPIHGPSARDNRSNGPRCSSLC